MENDMQWSKQVTTDIANYVKYGPERKPSIINRFWSWSPFYARK